MIEHGFCVSYALLKSPDWHWPHSRIKLMEGYLLVVNAKYKIPLILSIGNMPYRKSWIISATTIISLYIYIYIYTTYGIHSHTCNLARLEFTHSQCHSVASQYHCLYKHCFEKRFCSKWQFALRWSLYFASQAVGLIWSHFTCIGLV